MKKLFFIFLGLVLMLVFECGQVRAATLRINQSKIRLAMAGLTTKTGFIEVENPSEAALIVKVYMEDWKYAAGQDGSKEFFPVGTLNNSCAGWVSFYPSEFVIPAYGRQKIGYTVKAPDDFISARYAAIFFETTIGASSADESVGMNIVIKVGALFYIEPAKGVVRQGEVSNFVCSTDAARNNALSVQLDIVNQSNTDVATNSNFSVINKKGKVFARAALSDAYMLSGQSAQISGTWSSPLDEGIYDVVVTIDLGKAHEEAGLGRGPVIVKEAEIEVAQGGRLVRVGEFK